MFENVLEYSRMFWEKKFHGGGGKLQLQRLLRSRPPESEIEIELERTWEASWDGLDTSLTIKSDDGNW